MFFHSGRLRAFGQWHPTSDRLDTSLRPLRNRLPRRKPLNSSLASIARAAMVGNSVCYIILAE